MQQDIHVEKEKLTASHSDTDMGCERQSNSSTLCESEELRKCEQLMEEIDREKEKLNEENASSPVKAESPRDLTVPTGDIEAGLATQEQRGNKNSFWSNRLTAVIVFCIASAVCIVVLVVTSIIISKKFSDPLKGAA